MSPTPHSITIMAELERPGDLTVRAWPAASDSIPDAGTVSSPRHSRTGQHSRIDGSVQVQDTNEVSLHEVQLHSLTPGTQYHYEVSGTGLASVRGSFVTPPLPSESRNVPVRFVIYGDTRTHAAPHRAIVRAITHEDAEFVLHTGDMIENGRREEQWQTFFDIETTLLRNTIFVPVIGNHELSRPGVTGENRFRQYVHVEPSLPERAELDYVFRYGAVSILVANAYDDWSQPNMYDWLDHTLSTLRRQHPVGEGLVIVAMHWGLCSCGPHGENRALRRAHIDELFRTRQVDLVVSGHDHIFERGDDQQLPYMVTGGGGAELYRPRTSRSYTHVLLSQHHYVRAEYDQGKLEITALATDGTVLDRCTLQNRQWDCPSSPRNVQERHHQLLPENPQISSQDPEPQRSTQNTRGCNCRIAGKTNRHNQGSFPLFLAIVTGIFSRRRQT